MPGLSVMLAQRLPALSAELIRTGARRLWVFSGSATWCAGQAEGMRTLLAGDWLWVGDVATAPAPAGFGPHCAPSALKTLLGREYRHAVLDARHGLAADALAALAGTLTAGSWLVLLVPDWDTWPAMPDQDSLRWSEQAQPIAAPGFVHHLRQSIVKDPGVVLIRQGAAPLIEALPARPDWQPLSLNDGPTAGQRAVLQQLERAEPGIYVLSAARGRGKSALAGMLAARLTGRCWITAPAKDAAASVQQFAQSAAEFYAPDALLARRDTLAAPDWLLIDEAAALPMPLLSQLIGCCPRVLLTTTVQGYEGTGRGFLLKFCAALPCWTALQLDQPLRWANNDPLEQWLAEALLLSDPPVLPAEAAGGQPPLVISPLTRQQWAEQPAHLSQFYALLTSAHYRTSPLDLRRLFDAPGMHFARACCGQQLLGALWWVEEGGLSAGLAHAVWAGRRRPPGNLVAQSLAAHGPAWNAPCLRSWRISRIAVTAGQRRHGVGHQLIRHAVAAAHTEGLDFVSVSFGYTEPLWRFWQSAGFMLLRIGSHLEASSGCYSAMAVLPLSQAGRQLALSAAACFERDRAWRQPITRTARATAKADTLLNQDDWRSLAGFAWAQRPLAACEPALQRLVLLSPLPLPALRATVEQQQTVAESCQRLRLSGKRAWLMQARQEAAAALDEWDAASSARWRAWSDCLPAAGE